MRRQYINNSYKSSQHYGSVLLNWKTQAEFEQQGGNKMKKLLLGTMLFALVIVVPIPTMAQVGISVSIGLPPPIVFAAPPELIVIPETYVYVAP